MAALIKFGALSLFVRADLRGTSSLVIVVVLPVLSVRLVGIAVA